MTEQKKVSPNNPCPFLRALAAYGYVKEQAEKLSTIASKISFVGGEHDGKPNVPGRTLYIVALIANGLNPLRLFKSFSYGLDIDQLRNGPLDKKGAGSRIINAAGKIDQAELTRLNTYAIDVKDETTGQSERGLGLKQLQKMMDDNFERAKPSRRKIDRALMDGEWPVLLKVMGKNEGENRYLSLNELNQLFMDLTLPDRIAQRLKS